METCCNGNRTKTKSKGHLLTERTNEIQLSASRLQLCYYSLLIHSICNASYMATSESLGSVMTVHIHNYIYSSCCLIMRVTTPKLMSSSLSQNRPSMMLAPVQFINHVYYVVMHRPHVCHKVVITPCKNLCNIFWQMLKIN